MPIIEKNELRLMHLWILSYLNAKNNRKKWTSRRTFSISNLNWGRCNKAIYQEHGNGL